MSTIMILVGFLGFLVGVIRSYSTKTPKKNSLAITSIAVAMIFAGVALAPPVEPVHAASVTKSENVAKDTAAKKKASEKDKQNKAPSKADKAAQKKTLAANNERVQQENAELAALDYSGTQTIEVNNNKPTFTKADLSLANKSWENYGDLDNLNRATYAEAMLNKSLMPTKKRGDISKVKPTGWHSKKLGKSYLYNRSHLIGYTLSGENDNWKNLITGTTQLNNPEMLRHEMDIKTYLEKSKKNYVRYSVTPVFRGDELLARGVHMMAKSIGSDAISFNVYIFNVQDGVTINYADGTSKTDKEIAAAQQKEDAKQQAAASTGGGQEYVDANGNGLIKGSKNGIYHIPGSQYYDRTTNPAAWFKTVEEAEQAGYRAPR
ncbi:DNA/RNA non-specific endonuclease [Enterococcus sp. 669A]|uniref:DNA/RNA non-specific endonuclease n=1 Tax=Candidatus Enterococcus moelleringii TaxID=2815325 RepID=A0ABS3LB37_9ENTE|nr:DNA/RNA non-specific endonuclease [Enterococcus sp. 669A]MBO1306831.1 DNA/RNA non-specific endonuclease [Enterococcus sp. 669A]